MDADPHARKIISGGLAAVQGWRQSIRSTYKHLLMNLDVATTCFYPEGNFVYLLVALLDAVVAFTGAKTLAAVNRQYFTQGSQDCRRLARYLKNVDVLVTHREHGRRGYRIRGMHRDSAKNAQVQVEVDGRVESMSVAVYFEKTIGKRVVHPDLPVIDTDPILIPMEFLVIRKGQRHAGKLDDRQTADLIKLTALEPRRRAELINSGRK
ncbi:PAZ domain-containing protein [Chytridium lagenaria]|nr:PAZ domain-containing protein [Chytridium lagenaria]